MRKQTYFNQGFKGRASQIVALGERVQVIATFDVIFGVPLNFDATASKHAHSLLPALCLFLYHTNTLSQAISNEKLLKGPGVLNAVIFKKKKKHSYVLSLTSNISLYTSLKHRPDNNEI